MFKEINESSTYVKTKQNKTVNYLIKMGKKEIKSDGHKQLEISEIKNIV